MANQAKASNGSVFYPLKTVIEQQYFKLHGYQIVTGHLNGLSTTGVWLKLEDIAVAKAIRKELNSDKKAEDREGRCVIVNSKGLRTKCPESSHCSACPHCRTGKPLSLDIELTNKADKFQDARSEFEDDVVMTMLAKALMDHVHNLGGKYAKVMAALINGTSVRTFAEENKIGKSTAQDWFDQFKEMARDFLGE